MSIVHICVFFTSGSHLIMDRDGTFLKRGDTKKGGWWVEKVPPFRTMHTLFIGFWVFRTNLVIEHSRALNGLGLLVCKRFCTCSYGTHWSWILLVRPEIDWNCKDTMCIPSFRWLRIHYKSLLGQNIFHTLRTDKCGQITFFEMVTTLLI